MSTTIITNQVAVKFSVKDIIDSLNKSPDSHQVTDLLKTVYGARHLFSMWQDEYVFLVEEYIESNVWPQEPKWSAFLPVLPKENIVCGYIREALTLFEGGMVKFKGSGRTSPESALRKLRNTLKDAPNFDDYLRFNPRGLDFIFDMHEDVDAEAKEIISKLGFDVTKESYNQKSTTTEIGFLRFNIAVRNVRDIVKVIMINAISTQSSKVSKPRYQSSVLNKITNSMLNQVKD
jgi:hypothetical protein